MVLAAVSLLVPTHYWSLDHQCSPWFYLPPIPFLYKAFLLEAATSVSPACGIRTLQMEEAAASSPSGGPRTGKGEMGLAYVQYFILI